MIDTGFIIFFSILNCIGIIGWFITMLIAMDIVFCKQAHELNFRRILSRNICVHWAKLKRKLNIDKKYSASVLIFAGSIIAILMKVSELREVLDYTSWKVCCRVITSLLIPGGFISLYLSVGYKSSFLRQ